MRRRYLTQTLAVALSAATLAATTCAAPARAAQTVWAVTGSTQMYTLGALLVNRYASGQPNLQVAVNPTSSQAAFDDTCTGSGSQVGMSDVYIQDSQLREPGCDDMVNIPVAISATPVIYNLPGKYFTARQADRFTPVHPVKLTAQVVADIYMGKVRYWNDYEIARINGGVPLPKARIIAYNSSEPGGSGFIFNQWLGLSVPQWLSKVGLGLQPQWPPFSTGESSSGNMAQAIQSTPYSIGFAGFDYAISYKLQTAALRNASGFYVTPSLNGLSIAISKAIHEGFPIDFRKPFVTVKDPDAQHHAFNPAGFEFFVVHQNLTNRNLATPTRQSIKDFLHWAISSNGGQSFIEQIEFRKVGNARQEELAHGFIPVPQELRDAIAQRVNSVKI